MMLDSLDHMVASDPEKYQRIGTFFTIESLGVGFIDLDSARHLLGIPRKALCFSCDRFVLKYVTGLCDYCHTIVAHAEDESATLETIKALTTLLLGSVTKK